MKYPVMYLMEAKKTPAGYELFRDGQSVATPRNDREMECQLNFHGVHEEFCERFLEGLRKTGTASEEMPTVRVVQVDWDCVY